MIMSSGMEVGVNEGYAKLDELLGGPGRRLSRHSRHERHNWSRPEVR